MSEKKVGKVLLSQLEEALEERQHSDRRKEKKASLPAQVEEDRRKGSRRND